MGIFKSFDESLFREFKSSTKEGLVDIAADGEEIDKIEFEISESRNKIALRVDYSDFANHVFFGSAYSAVNFALSRILNDYPWDGELKEKNEWKRVNSGFENYFFDQYPKQHGHLFIRSGSALNVWAEVLDHQYKLRPETGSVAVDAVIKSHENLAVGEAKKTIFSYKEGSDSDGFHLYLSSSKTLNFAVFSGSTGSILSVDYNSYLSSAHAITCMYDQPSQRNMLYIDGEFISSSFVSSSFPIGIGEINIPSKKVHVGSDYSGSTAKSFFTGSLDDVRLWIGPIRKSELIKRNFFKPVHANISGGLKLYFKFNETIDANGKAIDYSGNELHATISGAYSYASNIISGTLTSWFTDPGDPIFSLANTQVSGFLSVYRTSGSSYDNENRNFIFKLIPSFFVDEETEHEDMQRFLLLVARHYDRLKLYIQHLSNIYNTDQVEFDNTPDELIGIVAKNYGMDLGSVYEGASALEYLFGENILPTGSLGCSLESIRNQLRRNLLSNLIYVIKTKSTREALAASLRSLGLEESVININEYSLFSGGITTTRTPRTVERRVANFTTSSNIFLRSGTLWDTNINQERSYEVRVLFNTGSTHLTSSIFTFFSGGNPKYFLEVERENLTSSNGIAKLYFTTGAVADGIVASSSLVSLFDNNWINFGSWINSTNSLTKIFLFVNKLDYDEISLSASTTGSQAHTLTGFNAVTGVLGSRSGSTSLFEGQMQEFRAWSGLLSQSIFIDHTKDFDSLSVADFAKDIGDLISHHKLNDFTGSTTGIGPIHDYAKGLTASTYTGFSSSALFNFPGVFIEKLEPSYSYDVAINNDKIRIRDRSDFDVNDIINDIPYLSVDMSPAISLNREIIKWFGDLEKFSNLIGPPFLRYREEAETLNHLRYAFFNERINSKINFESYLNLLKWFDSNFTFFLSQLIPLDMVSSLSNFVIESHLLEFNQVPRVFPLKKGRFSVDLQGSVSAMAGVGVALTARDIPLGDPGRFGSIVSASAEVFSDSLNMSSSLISGFLGLNFKNMEERKLLTDFQQENSQSLARVGYGNGWFNKVITGSNYLKNVLNVDSDFHISGVHFSSSADSGDSLYLSLSVEPINTDYTGAINGVMDQRWQWYAYEEQGSSFRSSPKHDFGIGYGGAWGQLWQISRKSARALNMDLDQNPSVLDGEDDLKTGIGQSVSASYVFPSRFITVREETDDTKTYILWPNLDSFEGVRVINRFTSPTTESTGTILPNSIESENDYHPQKYQKADFFGERVPLEDFKHLDVTIAAKRLGYHWNTASGFRDTPIRFKIKFQFFDKDLSGTRDFESIISSSIETDNFFSAASVGSMSTFKTSKIIHEYEYEQIAQSLTSDHDFVIHFERELPKAKYMRVHVRIEFPKGTSNDISSLYKVLIKGTLHKETTDVQNKIVSLRNQ